MSLIPRALPFVACASLLVACVAGETSGSLTVDYELLPPGASCESRGVATVRATLLQGDAVRATEEDACDPSSALVLDGIAAGNYQIMVEGLDLDEDTVVDNLGSDGEPDPIEVIGGSSSNFSADLFPTPATVRVRWSLEMDMFQAQCGTVPPAFFQITPFSNSGTFLDTPDGCGCHVFACGDLPDSDNQYHLVPDPTRDIDGDTLSSVRIEIQDSQGNPIDNEDIVVTPAPGAGKSVDITISCEGGACGAEFVTSAGEPGNLDGDGTG